MRIRQELTRAAWAGIAALAVACGAPSIDEIPEGTEVTVQTADGELVTGALADVDEEAVVVGGTRVERAAIAEVSTDDPPARVEVTVPGGTELDVALGTTVASNANQVGDPVQATLASALVQDGRTVAAAGSTLQGRVTAVEASGRVRGRAVLEVQFNRLQAGGITHTIATQPIRYVAEASTGEDARNIGIGAGIGALVGAIADGGQGAAIGAAVGGAGGTVVVLSTAGEEINLPTGTALDVALSAPFTVTVADE
jgi:hypothetical protein